MRVLLEASELARSRDLGGVQSYWRQLVPALLDEAGAEDQFLLLSAFLNPRRVAAMEAYRRRGAVLRHWWADPRWIQALGRRGCRAEWFAGPHDLIHAPEPCWSLPGRGRLVVTCHDLMFHHHPQYLAPGWSDRLLRGMERARSQAAFWICDSAFTRDDLVDAYGVSPGRTAVVHLGVDERFLEIVVPRIRGKIPSVGDGKSLIGDYVAINSELRARNVATLRKLGMASPNERRWLGKFERMTAKVFGRFADHRSYMYRGRLVDRQWHMGFDLASVKNDDVPAANDGTVVFAAYLGIYGNAVVLDHGFGLTTIYAHMSSIDVVPGDQVARGDTLGRTGATGLALGDHLHFEVQVRGVAVRPAQWWDARWVRDNIDAPFDAIGISSRARSRGTRAARRADGRRDR